MRIAIAGPPGSGKTTICMLVAKRFDYEFVLVGQLFRQLAMERGVDLDTFGRLAEEDETIDKELDKRMLAIARTSNDIIIEGRMSGPILKGNKVPVFAVYVDASEEIRAERIAKREGKSAKDVLGDIRIRERSERKRYMAYYGIDPSDRAIYDLWLDSSNTPADKVADLIIEKARKAEADNAHQIEKVD